MSKHSAYEGYHVWVNSVAMTVKMLFQILTGLMVVHLALIVAICRLTAGPVCTFGLWYLFYTFTNFKSLDSSILSLVLKTIIARGYWFFCLSFAIYLLLPFLLWRFKRKAVRQAEATTLRGARLATARDYRKKLRKGDLPLGLFRLPRTEEVKHCLACGRPGTGKTVFLSQVLERLQERNEKCVVYDYKGDYVSRFFDSARDLIFNPLDMRSAGWSVFNEIQTVLDINTVAESLIPPVYTGDAFWNDGARAVFSDILTCLYHHNLRTNRDIWNAVTAPAQQIRDWLDYVRKNHGGGNGFRFIEDAGSKMAMSVLAVMMQYTSAMRFMGPGTDFSIDKWLAGDGGCIFVTNQTNVKDTLRPILSLFIDLLGKKLLSLPDDLERRVFILLDEFGTLQRLSSIKDLLVASRSKGGSIWLGIQDVGQLNKLYTPDLASSIINACGTSMIFAVSDPKTASYFSDKLGRRQYEEMIRGNTMGAGRNREGISLTTHHVTDNLILDAQLLGLHDLHAYLKVPNVEDIVETVLAFKAYPLHADSFQIRPDLVLPVANQNAPPLGGNLTDDREERELEQESTDKGDDAFGIEDNLPW